MNNKLKEVLKEKDRTVSFLYRKTNISRYSLDLIVQGKKSPTIKQAIEIAEALDVNREKIFLMFELTLTKAKV